MFTSIRDAIWRMLNGTTETTDGTTAATTPAKPSVKAAAVTDDSFEQTVLKSELPVLVDFFATWCGPCQRMGPKMDQLASEYDGRMVVVKVDTDQQKRFGRTYEVKRIPTLLYFYKGQVISRSTSDQPIEKLRADCDSLLKTAAEAASKK